MNDWLTRIFGHLTPFDYVTITLSLILVLVAVCHRRIPALRGMWHAYRKSVGVVTVLLVAAVFVIGVLFADRADSEVSQLMHAVQLLKLNAATKVTIGDEFARGCSLLLWVIIGIEVNRRLLFSSLHEANLLGIRNHAIVCGLGDVGVRITRDLTAAKQNVVVIEQDPSHPLIDDVEERRGDHHSRQRARRRSAKESARSFGQRGFCVDGQRHDQRDAGFSSSQTDAKPPR